MNKMRRIGLTAMVAAALFAAGCAASKDAAQPTSAPPSSSKSEAPAEPTATAPAEEVSGGEAGPAAQQPGQPAPPPAAGATPAPDVAAKPTTPSKQKKEAERDDTADARPGLGTEWGETRTSRISTVSFLRADPDHPFAMASLFYNDEQGARAMANAAGFQRTGAQASPVAGGAVSIGLRNEDGRFLSGFVAGEKRFAVGEAGMRYTIVLRNLTENRFECVVSVDGLDVLDGQAASFSKRGYILDPHGELEIDGFRQSVDEVAAFRFGSVRNSYANQKHGDARNVGIIGVALFHERGATPWTPDEIQRRNSANPFPGQFATPPGVP
jgi:hypothetical protein